VQVIARSATARSTERLNLPLRREVFEKPESENIETESCQALVYMDTCYPQCSSSISGMYNYSTSTMYTPVSVLCLL
jgi:hypothetical protein